MKRECPRCGSDKLDSYRTAHSIKEYSYITACECGLDGGPAIYKSEVDALSVSLDNWDAMSEMYENGGRVVKAKRPEVRFVGYTDATPTVRSAPEGRVREASMRAADIQPPTPYSGRSSSFECNCDECTGIRRAAALYRERYGNNGEQ